MSNTLPLSQHLFDRGRRLTTLNQHAAARQALGKLLERPEESRSARATTHALLGNVELAAGRMKRARKQFAAAFSLEPNNPRYFADYAEAVLADNDANPLAAFEAGRRATQIDPTEPRYWIAFGRAAVRMGKRKTALLAFRQAERQAPGDFESMAAIINGYLSLGQMRSAKSALAGVVFRFRRDGRTATLARQVRFEITRRRQEKSASPARVLPFVRLDVKSVGQPHLFRLLGAAMRQRPA